MENRDIMYVYNDTNFEIDINEIICALIEREELSKEEIIGYKLDIAEKEPILYKDFDLSYLMEIIDGQFGDDRYDENGYVSDRIAEVFKKHINFKTLQEELNETCLYYVGNETYTITEEDYNNYNQ